MVFEEFVVAGLVGVVAGWWLHAMFSWLWREADVPTVVDKPGNMVIQ